jgi:hypothetical protein
MTLKEFTAPLVFAVVVVTDGVPATRPAFRPLPEESFQILFATS